MRWCARSYAVLGTIGCGQLSKLYLSKISSVGSTRWHNRRKPRHNNLRERRLPIYGADETSPGPPAIHLQHRPQDDRLAVFLSFARRGLGWIFPVVADENSSHMA